MAVKSQRPDWLIIGVDCGHYVMVIGSMDVDKLEIDMQGYADPGYWLGQDYAAAEPPEDSISVIKGQIGKYTMVRGNTYIEALRMLLQSWDPDSARTERRALGTTRRAIR